MMPTTWSRFAKSWAENSEPRAGFLRHVIDHRFEVALAFFEDLELAIGAGAGLEDRANTIDGFAAAQFIDNRIDQGEIFLDQIAQRNLLLLAEVDELAVEAVADGAE